MRLETLGESIPAFILALSAMEFLVTESLPLCILWNALEQFYTDIFSLNLLSSIVHVPFLDKTYTFLLF